VEHPFHSLLEQYSRVRASPREQRRLVPHFWCSRQHALLLSLHGTSSGPL
jgi:hypothetical protein